MIKIESLFNEDPIGKVLVCNGVVIEITGIGNNEFFGKPFLDDDIEDYPDRSFNTDYSLLLERGFTLMTKETASEVFKPFFQIKKQRVAV